MFYRPRVLIVDDEPGVREALAATLRGKCEVRVAASAEEALEMVAESRVDVVTLDVNMPGMDGLELLERLRQIDVDTEALIVTGYGSLETAVTGLRLRACDYLTKPFDREQVESAIERAAARRLATEALKRARESFLSAVSHELRTPLNVIVGYSSILQEEADGQLTDEQRLALDRIQANSTALLTYVENIFYLLALESGELACYPQRLVLAETIAEATEPFTAEAARKGLDFKRTAGNGLTLTSDREMVRRVVAALVDNAVKYTERGEVVVGARARPAGGAVIVVADTGPGLSAEEMAACEAPPPLRLDIRPGSGLGLRLAHRTLAVLRGSMRFTARPGGGTVVEVALPHLPAHAEEYRKNER